MRNSPIKNKGSMAMNNVDMSPVDKRCAEKGEEGQGAYLIDAKERNSDIKQKRNKSSTSR